MKKMFAVGRITTFQHDTMHPITQHAALIQRLVSAGVVGPIFVSFKQLKKRKFKKALVSTPSGHLVVKLASNDSIVI